MPSKPPSNKTQTPSQPLSNAPASRLREESPSTPKAIGDWITTTSNHAQPSSLADQLQQPLSSGPAEFEKPVRTGLSNSNPKPSSGHSKSLWSSLVDTEASDQEDSVEFATPKGNRAYSSRSISQQSNASQSTQTSHLQRHSILLPLSILSLWICPGGQFGTDADATAAGRAQSNRSSVIRDFSSLSVSNPSLKEKKYFPTYKSVEEQRLEEDAQKRRHWKRWGPYLSERQWATRAYRWGEDGIGGISDNHGRLALSFALWNENDPILKERLFGVTGHQGNHGETLRNLLLSGLLSDAFLHEREFPYKKLVEESKNRSRDVSEFEILETDAFDDNKYWGCICRYAKDEENENGISVRIAAYNRGPDPATLHIVPQVWIGEVFHFYANPSPAPASAPIRGQEVIETEDIVCPELLFTENETNFERLYGGQNRSYAKDAFHDHIIRPTVPIRSSKDQEVIPSLNLAGEEEEEEEEILEEPYTPRQYVNPEKTGTKAGAHYVFRDVPPHGGYRRQDADEFYARLNPGEGAVGGLSEDLRNIMRQALAGMLWTSSFLLFNPPPPPERKYIRNRDWKHMYIEDILSMPDKWELQRCHPPVHAWATFRVFKIERKMYGREDLPFLERVFQKLLLNFTWWVNRKDASGQTRRDSLDGILRLNMLNMALELAKHNPVYEDIASKFFEHFLFISEAMTFGDSNDEQSSLWNDEDGFYYDAISWGVGNSTQLPVRSLVGLIPLYATLTLEPGVLKRFPGFKKRMDWFIENRPELATKGIIANMRGVGKHERKLLALANEDRLKRILERMLDESEFLSAYGIRSLSLYHKENPYKMQVNGEEFSVEYWPADSKSGMFGGNSNWRGPIWLATTFLLIESLQRFYQYHGTNLKVECPKGSGDMLNLAAVADEIQHRIIHIFARDAEGRRACNGGLDRLDKDPFFLLSCRHGQGSRCFHQTGWTGLVAWMIFQTGSTARLPRTPRTPRSSADHYFAESVPPTPNESEHSFDGTHTGSGSRNVTEAMGAELSPDEVSYPTLDQPKMSTINS
ncbi:hypothetical protein H4Q26_000718 [Puccinia striiformis f. sp. tritici PST-130]|nr:hypothetical protein H4Q26_000718 [Puccinia striiformis f. sp. tritici PST-130]